METKRNLKFFTSKGISIFVYISIALMAIGVVLCIVSNKSTALLMSGVLIVLVGLCFLMFSSSGKSNELDIDATCQAMTKELIELATKRFDVYERSYLRMIHPIELKAYQFPEKGEYLMKKASDGQLRTNLFAGVYMFFTNDNAYFFKRAFSVTDESVLTDEGFKIPYAKFVDVKLEEHPIEYMAGKKEKTYMDYIFIVTSTEGEVFRMSVTGGADVEKAVKDLNHLIDVKHKNPTDRLATEGGKYQSSKNFN